MKRLIALLYLFPTVIVAAAEAQKFASHFKLDATDVPAAVRQETKPQPWDSPERGPVAGLKIYAKEKAGAVWLGSDQGAARFDPKSSFRWERWQYFYGRRWLLDNEVKNIYVDETGSGRKVRRKSRASPVCLPARSSPWTKRARAAANGIPHPTASGCGTATHPDGGGGGNGEDDGAFFLLPYWMGRYHGWVK